MGIKRYRQIRAGVAIFTAAITSMAVTRDSYLLATIGVLTGMFFLGIVRSKTKITIDEREKTIREKAAQIAYSIFTPTIGLGSFFLFAFARREYFYLESLAIILAYLTLFLIALYAISYYFLNRKYGGNGNEE